MDAIRPESIPAQFVWRFGRDFFEKKTVQGFPDDIILGKMVRRAIRRDLLDEIEDKFALLSEQPRLGRARPDIAPELRYFPVGSYLILYREITDGIEVVSVVHGARRLNNLL